MPAYNVDVQRHPDLKNKSNLFKKGGKKKPHFGFIGSHLQIDVGHLYRLSAFSPTTSRENFLSCSPAAAMPSSAAAEPRGSSEEAQEEEESKSLGGSDT